MSEDETEQGRALFEELTWVHGFVRRDLATVQRLAGEVAEGLAAEELGRELEQLKTRGPLWRLKVNCLRYCSFVHSHHNAEDVLLFPAMREVDPSSGPIIDRLEADHRRVSDLLDAVEVAALELTDDEGDGARDRVVAALDELAAHLLEHLEFEELQGGPIMRRLERFPSR